jgi:hypothetical protein
VKNTKLKWERSLVPLVTKTRFRVAEQLGMAGLNEYLQTNKIGTEPFTFQNDWAKVVHLWDNKFFVTGGSMSPENLDPLQQYLGHSIYSDKAYIIDSVSGVVTEKMPMSSKR